MSQLHGMRSGSAGFTLLEVMFAATLLVVGMVGLLGLLDAANAGTARVRALEGATTLARQVTEAARSVPYSELTPQTIEASLQRRPGLEDQSAGLDWTIERRGFRYTVTAAACTADDPADGTGAHPAGVFCPGAGPDGTADRNPDDYKRVRVDVSWDSGSSVRRVRQVALISNPGSFGGPSITDLTLVSPTSSPVTSEVPEIGLAATTSSPATSVTWSVDGVVQTTANGSSTSWWFAWPVSELGDGTHLVSAQAFDLGGLSGAMRSLTITLNRFRASAPTGLAGGRNGSMVEFEWLPNPSATSSDTACSASCRARARLACTLTRKTCCQDEQPAERQPVLTTWWPTTSSRRPAS